MKNTRLFLLLSTLVLIFFAASQKVATSMVANRAVDTDANYETWNAAYENTDKIKTFAKPTKPNKTPKQQLTESIETSRIVLANTSPVEKKNELPVELRNLQNNTINTSFSPLVTSKTASSKIENLMTKIAPAETTLNKQSSENNISETAHVNYWDTVYSIESKQGKLLYRPRNKQRNCTYTHSPCGHYQLTVKALKDIGCKSLQCRKDRLNFKKSLAMSKKLLALNEKRLRKNGIDKLEDYQRYLIHQQGATGIRHIISATKGKRELSSKEKRNMANNSPYSYRKFKRMGSKLAAEAFLAHWQKKWESEKRLVAGIQMAATDNQENDQFVPIFTDSEIVLALNYKF